MPGRPCSICRDSAKSRRATEMIAAGVSDQAIADAIGAGRAAVQRHRTAHIVAPARALVEAAAKGREVRERREEMLAAAESGDPSAFVALASIVDDLRRVHQRLERTADAAEQDNQRLAVASLSSQQLRAAEVRAKIGGVGGYAAPRVREGEGAPVFALTINLPGQTERIVATAEPIGGPPTLEVDAGPVGPRSVFRIPAMLPDEPSPYWPCRAVLTRR